MNPQIIFCMISNKYTIKTVYTKALIENIRNRNPLTELETITEDNQEGKLIEKLQDQFQTIKPKSALKKLGILKTN